MAKSKPYDSILFRDGLSRQQKDNTLILQEGYFKPDERSMEDIFKFAKDFAAKVNFYEFESFENNPLATNLTVEDCKDGNWSAFFEGIVGLQNIDGQNGFQPHVALFLSFLKIFSHAQDNINRFTQRHLAFYYKKILGLNLHQGIEDNAYVIFELAKNASETLIVKGTGLDAGKLNGIPATYHITEDVVINKALIGSLKTIHVKQSENGVIRFAAQTDTQDGLSQALPKESPYFDAFGLRHIPEADAKKAKIGFAIASPMLLLKNGYRVITISFELNGLPRDLNNETASRSIEVFITGEKNWFSPQTSATLKYGTFINGRQKLIITATLAHKEPAALPYVNEVHKGAYNTQQPLMQVLFDTTQPNNLFRYLHTAIIENISVDVDVKEVTELQLSNDNGVINPQKPFMPFGPVPKKGSSFTVAYDELMQKNITEYQFNVQWLDAPQNFSDYYAEYAAGVTNSSFTASYKAADDTEGTTALFNVSNASLATTWPLSPFKLIFPGFLYTAPFVVYPNYYSLFSNPNFFNTIVQTATIHKISSISGSILVPQAQNGFIKFELGRSFLHEAYSRVYSTQAIAIASNPNASPLPKLPKEPYTPTIKNISLNYKASLNNVNINNTSFVDFNKKQVQFFHVNVFGQSEQHGYLKDFVQQNIGVNHVLDKNIYLFPQLNTSQFFIGLKDAKPGQSVSMLFQLVEGSSNPDADPETINWYVLCSNEWRKVTSRELLKNETNNLLQPGIIRLVIPNSATTDNTVMDSGMVWLKASIDKNPAAVCLVNKIFVQAARAAFVVSEAGTAQGSIAAGAISKLFVDTSAVKVVRQPFSSFGGRPVESENSFYTRVSERLRHKQRGVANWDYEHLVLQNFSEIYKAKCLNHFNDEDDCCKTCSPGFVTIVVVPHITNKNAYNPLQPKVSTNTREKIKAFLQPQVSFFTNLFVVNPDYETVLLDFKVRFTTAGDFGLYSDKLNEALKEFLTPWAFDRNMQLHFGGTINKSVLLNFLEEIPFVDFVTELKLFHIDENGVSSNDLDEVKVTNPKAILVSHAQHRIKKFTTEDVCV